MQLNYNNINIHYFAIQFFKILEEIGKNYEKMPLFI